MQNVNPTRSELANIKNRIKLADTGYNLLKKKRDGLIHEFYGILSEAKDLRKELNEKYVKANQTMQRVIALEGIVEVKSMAFALKDNPSVELSIKNVMGVSVPTIMSSNTKKSLNERGYGLITSSLRIEELTKCYEDLLESIIKSAEIETKLRKILEEIEKTKRRVNALEYVVIPKLKDQKVFITLRLEEIERESTYVMKKVKSRME